MGKTDAEQLREGTVDCEVAGGQGDVDVGQGLVGRIDQG